MPSTIPQRELRNNIGEILRRAEAGERFTVTVSGRPVAELGPVADATRKSPNGEDLARLISETPVDDRFVDDVRRLREEDRARARDPWN